MLKSASCAVEAQQGVSDVPHFQIEMPGASLGLPIPWDTGRSLLQNSEPAGWAPEQNAQKCFGDGAELGYSVVAKQTE
jgi:hypothetical protein